jgi:branched-chain amino acid transport system permease protein
MVLEQVLVDWAHLTLLAAAIGFLLHETGFLSLGHAGLVLAGGYAVAFASLGVLSPLGVVASAVLPLGVLAVVGMRVRDDIFAVVTLAIAEAIRLFVLGADELTQGALGLGPVPRYRLFIDAPLTVITPWVVVLVAVSGAVLVLRQWPGLSLGSIRDGELFSRAVGMRTIWIRFFAVLLSGTGAIVAGALQIQYFGLAAPTMGTLDVSLQAIAAAMLAWPLWRHGRPLSAAIGFVLASLTVVTLPPLLRAIGPSSADAAVWRQAALGILLFSLVHPRSPFAAMLRR